jgi:DNA-binding response OmpR family regulator
MTSPTPPARILVCDDDPALAAMVAAILHREGYHTYQANTGPECIALVDRGEIDLILLDVGMPDMDGFAICDALRARDAGRHLPIVLLTGRTDLDTRVESMHHGVSEFLTKPVNRYELVARVRAQLRIVALTRQLETIERDLQADTDGTSPTSSRL